MTGTRRHLLPSAPVYAQTRIDSWYNPAHADRISGSLARPDPFLGRVTADDPGERDLVCHQPATLPADRSRLRPLHPPARGGWGEHLAVGHVGVHPRHHPGPNLSRRLRHREPRRERGDTRVLAVLAGDQAALEEGAGDLLDRRWRAWRPDLQHLVLHAGQH